LRKTIQTQLEDTGNRPSGFDYLRLSLAIAIIVWHSISVSYGQPAEAAIWSGNFRPVIFFLVPSFFALSGFLVASSLERNDLSVFVLHRIIRIYPALALEVMLSAFILGPLLTELPLKEYFSDTIFWSYLLNATGYIHYLLPGVFVNNPSPKYVNLQLWTVPLELRCYVAITVLGFFKVYRAPRLSGFLLLLILFGLAASYLWRGFPPIGGRPSAALVVMAFLFGASIYFLRAVIVYSWSLFVFALILSWVLMSFAETQLFAAITVAYVTVFIGLLNPAHSLFSRLADYSYGVYLYGYPVQQTFAYLFPSTRDWYINSVLSVGATLVIAAISWHCVEARVAANRRAITNAFLAIKSRSIQLMRG
jgi:peptidoglycan/LPS O-acetylase OafA/YrhL